MLGWFSSLGPSLSMLLSVAVIFAICLLVAFCVFMFIRMVIFIVEIPRQLKRIADALERGHYM